MDKKQTINKVDEALQKATKYIDENGGARLLWGIGLILALQVIFFFSWLGKLTTEQEISLATIESEVKINRSLAGDETIADRLKVASETVEQFRGRLYEASTTGLIAADVEAFLSEAAEEAGLDRVRISLNYEKTDSKEIVKFVADITAQEKESGVFPLFLSKVLSADKAYTVSSLAWSKRIKRLNLKVECVGRLVEVKS